MYHPPRTPFRKHQHALIPPLARSLARCRAAHRRIGQSSPLAEPGRIEHNAELLGPVAKRHALGLLGWAEVPIAACARTCTRTAPGRRARATADRARAFCCYCCCCCCCWHAPAAAAAAAPPTPPGGPQPPGATSEHTGARTPSCPRSPAPMRTQLRSSLARHCLIRGRRAAAP